MTQHTKHTTEHAEQAALFRWAALMEPTHPELHWLAAWPNGGFRHPATAARLKAEGVKRGPVDVWLFVRRGHCPGLAFEMKVGRNKPTDEQSAWLRHLDDQDWCTGVCYDWMSAARLIADYLGFEAGV